MRVVWLAFPIVLIAASLWLMAGSGSTRIPLVIVVALSILGCVRQVQLLWRKGQTTYASVTLAAILVGIAATLIVFLRAG